MEYMQIVKGLMSALVVMHTGCQPADALFAVESEFTKRGNDAITAASTQEIVLEAVKRVGG